MKVKRMMLVTLMLLAVLTIGAVSATDTVNNLTASETHDPIGLDVDDGDIIADDDDEGGDDDEEDFGDDDELEYEISVATSLNIENEIDLNIIEYYFSNCGEGGNLTVYFNDSLCGVYDVEEGELGYLSIDDLGITDLTYGTYAIDITYSGDDKFEGFSETYDLRVNWGFDVYNPYYDEDITIGWQKDFGLYVALPGDAEGNVTYTVNGKRYTISVDEIWENYDIYSYGIIIPADSLIAGDNELNFTYIGSDYPLDSCSIDVEVVYEIVINNTEITYDESTNIYLNLPADAKGSLNVYEVFFDDNDIYSTHELVGSSVLKNGFASVSVSNLKPGLHYYYAEYTGTDYGAVLGDLEEEGPCIKVTPIVDLPSRIYSGVSNNLTITVPGDSVGIMRLTIDEEERSVSIKNGKASIELFNFESTEYGVDYPVLSIELEVICDDYYFSDWYGVDVSDTNPNFNFTVDIQNVILKGDQYCYLNYNGLPEDVSGNIEVYIDGNFFGLKDKDAYELNLSSLDLGTHDIEFFYLGDGYYKPANTTSTVEVCDVIMHISSECIIGTYPGYASISDFATIRTIYEEGQYTLLVDGKLADMNFMEKSEKIRYSFTRGVHEVELIYTHGNVRKSENSTVIAKYYMGVDCPEEISLGDDLFIDFDFPLEVEGNLIVTADKEYKVPIANGHANVTISNLGLGEHIIYIEYDGSAYPEIYSEVAVLVSEKQYDAISCNLDDYENEIGYGKEIIFTVHVPQDFVGKLDVCDVVNYGETNEDTIHIKTVDIADGSATVKISNLAFGVHELIAEIIEYDTEMYDIDDSLSVVVHVNPIVNGSVQTYYNRVCFGENLTLPVELPGDAAGKLYLCRVLANDNGTEETIILDEYNLVEGKANVEITKYYYGYNWLYLKYDDNKYHIFDSFAIIWVFPEISYPNEMTVGEDEYAVLTLPGDASGNLTILGVRVPIINGVGKLSLSNLDVGLHYISVVYEGDEKYGNFYSVVYDSYECVVEVKKVETSISVSKSSDDLIVELNGDATGEIIVQIADKFYPVILENGKATVSGVDVASNETILLSYSGNGEYAQFNKKSIKVGEIIKNKVKANLTVNAPDINEGETAAITFTISELATGNILVQIGNDNYTAPITKGSASLNVSDLAAGQYNVIAIYEGNGDVLTGRKETSFKVNIVKVDPIIVLAIPVDFFENSTQTIYAGLSDKATGEVIFKLGSEEFRSPIENGWANVTLRLTRGVYNITAIYEGNDYVLPGNMTAEFSVIIPAPVPVITMSAKAVTVTYNNAAKFSVNLYLDGAAFSGQNVEFKINGKFYKNVQTNSNGVATVKISKTPGTYKITAIAAGKSVTKKLVVKHVVTLKKVKVKRSAKKLVLTATLKKLNGKYLKNKKVTFKFKGKKYTAKTNKKGVAKLIIKSTVLKKLKVGKKVTYQATYLKDTVKKTVKVSK